MTRTMPESVQLFYVFAWGQIEAKTPRTYFGARFTKSGPIRAQLATLEVEYAIVGYPTSGVPNKAGYPTQSPAGLVTLLNMQFDIFEISTLIDF